MASSFVVVADSLPDCPDGGAGDRLGVAGRGGYWDVPGLWLIPRQPQTLLEQQNPLQQGVPPDVQAMLLGMQLFGGGAMLTTHWAMWLCEVGS